MTESSLRERLRAARTTAMRARDKETASVLRSALAALDHAEAVPVSDAAQEQHSAHVAGGQVGVGASEAARRTLTTTDEQRLVREEVAELRVAARQYADSGHPERAAAADRGAALLEDLLHG